MFDKLDTNIIDGMERGLLSSILFDNDSIKQIKENIFSNPQYGKIFDAMIELYNNKYPINEETIYAKIGSTFEQALLNIYSTNPISHLDSIYNSLVENKFKIYLQNQLKKIATDDLSSLHKLNELEALIQRSKDFKRQEIFNFVDFSQAESKNPSFYLENILPVQENEINIISAPGGSGKSYLSLFLALHFVHAYTPKNVFYG